MMQTEIILKSQLSDAATALIDFGAPEIIPGVLALCAVFGVRIDNQPRYNVEIVPQIEALHD